MKIYLAIKFHANNQNQPLIEKIISHLSQQGHEIVCAVRDFEEWGQKQYEPRELLLKAFSAIENSDLVLIEATEKGMGVGIEAGFAFAKHIPIVTIAKPESDISSNLRSLSRQVITYEDIQELRLN